MKEAGEPHVPVGISDRTFELVDQHLNSLDYDGMTALSCNDTKITPASRLYWDAKKKAHFVVGREKEPLCVADPDGLKEIFDNADFVKASKVSHYPRAFGLHLMFGTRYNCGVFKFHY